MPRPSTKFRGEALLARHRYTMDCTRHRLDCSRSVPELQKMLGDVVALRTLQCYLPMLQTLERLDELFASLRYTEPSYAPVYRDRTSR